MNGHCEGFSMIELIMAMVIMGIMAAVAFPKFGNISSIDVYNAARQAKSDIRYTQELAMSKYRQTTIAFDSTSSNPSTYTITSAGSSETKELPKRSKAIFNAVGTGGTTDLSFTFNATGEPIVGGDGILAISSGGFDEQIMVSNFTGTASIMLNP